MKSIEIESKKAVLIKNTIMLYLLTFSNYFFGFITIPYQTRILGPEFFGKLSFAAAFTAYFQLFIDFGFILSATAEVAKYRENKKELSKIVLSVAIIKIILAIVAFIIILLLCFNVSTFKGDSFLYILYFFGVAIGSLFPDYLYRGLEQMTMITVRTVIIRLFFTVTVFLFVQSKEDYYIIPFLNLLANLIAVCCVYLHAVKTVGIKIVRVQPEYIYRMLRQSSLFFFSRIASTVYGATNVFILGIMYSTGGNTVGLYASADKLINVARSGFSPIADSLYPYMIKNRDFKIVEKTIFILMPPVVLGCIIVGAIADDFCAALFGEEFRGSGKILKSLIPIVIITPLTYILGFPVMAPMRLTKYCNLSILVGAFVHILGLGVLIIIDKFNIISLCYITLFTELIILLFRILVVYKNRSLMRNGGGIII